VNALQQKARRERLKALGLNDRGEPYKRGPNRQYRLGNPETSKERRARLRALGLNEKGEPYKRGPYRQYSRFVAWRKLDEKALQDPRIAGGRG